MNFNESTFLFVANRLQFLFLSGALGVRSEELLQHFPKFSKAKQDAHGRARAPGPRSVHAPWPRACRPPPPPAPAPEEGGFISPGACSGLGVGLHPVMAGALDLATFPWSVHCDLDQSTQCFLSVLRF